jgi:hypothetical protein
MKAILGTCSTFFDCRISVEEHDLNFSDKLACKTLASLSGREPPYTNVNAEMDFVATLDYLMSSGPNDSYNPRLAC